MFLKALVTNAAQRTDTTIRSGQDLGIAELFEYSIIWSRILELNIYISDIVHIRGIHGVIKKQARSVTISFFASPEKIAFFLQVAL